LTLAALLSARSDVVANVVIVVAGLITAHTLSIWPDLLIGLGLAMMNAAGLNRRPDGRV
jgi:Co/Zn/Cd efflux system component